MTSIRLASDQDEQKTAEIAENADGQLRLHEIYNLQLKPGSLVVLSACETALGKRDEGDAVVGMPRGFLYAGAGAVVSTLWPISDASSAALMEDFHRRLHDGATRSRALREAQRKVMRLPEWQSPYYWAGFTMTGRE